MSAMQATAALCYDGNTYPYFFKDTNGDKQCSTSEVASSNGFTEVADRSHSATKSGNAFLAAGAFRTQRIGMNPIIGWEIEDARR